MVAVMVNVVDLVKELVLLNATHLVITLLVLPDVMDLVKERVLVGVAGKKKEPRDYTLGLNYALAG